MSAPPPPPPFATDWADPRVALDAAGRVGTDRVLVVGGAGDLPLDLAALGLRVAWSPLDPADRARFALRLAAAGRLPAPSIRALLGLDAGGRRIWFLHHLAPALPPDVAAWWAAREPGVRTGIVRWGAFEQRVDRVARALGLRELTGARGALARRALDVHPDGGPLDAWLLGTPAEPARAHPWLGEVGLARLRAAPPEDGEEGDLVCLPEPERVPAERLAALGPRPTLAWWRGRPAPGGTVLAGAGPVRRAVVLSR